MLNESYFWARLNKGGLPDELKRAAEWYSNEISRFIQRNNKIASFQKLLDIGELASTPDLDQLDRLMRYQTTLQRQLSTAIGELLALIKSNGHRP